MAHDIKILEETEYNLLVYYTDTDDPIVIGPIKDESTKKNCTFGGKNAPVTQTLYDALTKIKEEKGCVVRWYVDYIKDENTRYVKIHAIERMRERFSWNKSTALRMCKKIFEKAESEGYDKTRLKLEYGDMDIIIRDNTIITAFSRDDMHGYKTFREKYHNYELTREKRKKRKRERLLHGDTYRKQTDNGEKAFDLIDLIEKITKK